MQQESHVPDQPFEAGQGFRKAAANASRTFIELLAALDRWRGKGGQQVVRVEHIHVHRGGQAIVGNVKAGETATKSVPPLAIGQDAPGFTMDDLIGKQPELVGREGYERRIRGRTPRLPSATAFGTEYGWRSKNRPPLWCAHAGLHAL